LHPLRKEDVVIRILVTGSRNWTDVAAIDRAMHDYMGDEYYFDDFTIVHGASPTGLDALAEEWAVENYMYSDPHPADWTKHGRAAGPIRNQWMVDLGADACLGFPLGESRGTLDCMTRAHRASIPVWKCGVGIEPWTP